ncbi:MAG: RAMP superfamily CRISPR-associated protein [Syntrophorhabdaceae bacterium]|nr:RAMP superfamily CRISPR-associated protein [Syntrophorhabdaceae bacterium]
MDARGTIYLQRAKLITNAHGYWYTSGGEKGPFGFYPHLKDSDGYPVYPDTQLHGDLRMAAEWFLNINGSQKEDFITEIFGDNPKGKTRQIPSRLFLTDLTLDENSKKKWSFSRFEVKPRIAIDDKIRTVEEHMLVFQEMAYLEGLTLHADLYLGYFQDEKGLNDAKELINAAVSLLSGFGQSRSRGYGRGSITINWDEPEVLTFQEIGDEYIPSNITYTITNLVHLRNKPVEPGSTQFLPSRRIITDHQLKAWFSKTYFDLFRTWPTIEELEQLKFSYLYPSIKENGDTVICYPPAMTTLKNEEDIVQDTLNLDLTYEEKDVEDRENFFKTKTKTLSQDFFVTSIKPLKAFKIDTERRIRNQVEGNFATGKERGLFVQEFIKRGTCFSGTIKINPYEKFNDFLKRALYILKNIKPIINGALFHVEWKDNIDTTEQRIGPWLVYKSIPFSPEFLNLKRCPYEKQGERIVLKDANIITIKTEKAYNTTLKRPRRPNITIKPGSILFNTYSVFEKDALKSWMGFGQNLLYEKEKTLERYRVKPIERQRFELSKDILEELKDMTPSQAGFLKEFLNRHRKIGDINRLAKERMEKYEKKVRQVLLNYTTQSFNTVKRISQAIH